MSGTVDEFRAQFAEAAHLPVEEQPEASPVEETETVATEVPTEEEIVETEQAEEEVGTAETEAVEETPLLAGKYKTTEDLEKAYTEMQTVLGRQGAEVAELRGLRDEFVALREQIAAPQTPQYDPGSVDEFFAENPAEIPAAAQQAIDNGDGYLYDRAIKAWAEHDPVGANDFHTRKLIEADRAQREQELAPLRQQHERAQTTNQFVAAYEQATSKHDDFAQVMNSITDETISGFPVEVLSVLQTGDQASKERVLETLYRWTKAEQAGNLTEAVREAARETQQESRTARQQAAVATGSVSQTREPATGVDAFHEAFQNSDAFRKAAGLA